jgi:hypothetical protein
VAPAARQQQLTMADLESMRDNSETVRAVLDNMGVGQAWVIPSSPKPN